MSGAFFAHNEPFDYAALPEVTSGQFAAKLQAAFAEGQRVCAFFAMPAASPRRTRLVAILADAAGQRL